ncbi:MAG: DUF2079 domain-containing protein [Myxococcota bacterium]
MRREAKRRVVLGVAWVVLFGFAYARFRTFHNQTFDLAFYSRMAWGLSAGDVWDPFLNAHVLGLHVSPVLVPLGWLGHLLGTPMVLLAAQAAAAVGAASLLGRFGERRLGQSGWMLGVTALLAHPNLGHVVTYEAHPGTLALLPLAGAIERLDAKDRRGFLIACVGILACREDLALSVVLLAALAFRWRGLSIAVGTFSLVYLAVFIAFLHPRFAPDTGSFELHFGHWGDSMGAAVTRWFTDPAAVFAHLRDPDHASYLPRILAPLALLPLLRLRWLLPAAPILAINLLSQFPTTTQLDSHYLTPALPFLVAAALAGATRIPRKMVAPLLALSLGLGLGIAGVDPAASVFRFDARSEAAEAIVGAIGAGSVQAPDPLLAHLSERDAVHRAPPPDRNADWVVLDTSHRDRYAEREVLLRTSEEPNLRTWLARPDYGVVLAASPWILLHREAESRDHLQTAPRLDASWRLCDCLSVQRAYRERDGITLELVAHAPCPADLALRIGARRRPRRVDLLFDGVVSPAHLREGDVVRSHHAIRVEGDTIRVGALRSSGARPAPEDPVSQSIPLLPSAESSAR